VRLLVAWLPAIAIAALIFGLSAQQHLAVSDGPLELVLRKLAHLTVYAALAVAVAFALRAHGLPARRAFPAAFALTVAYAISDELHQTTVPGRVGTPVDVAIDAVGAACGLLLRRRSRQPA
jgi:VanZ family protein